MFDRMTPRFGRQTHVAWEVGTDLVTFQELAGVTRSHTPGERIRLGHESDGIDQRI